MAKSEVTSSNSVPIDRPLCPKCGSVMWLVRIEPKGQGIDKQTFGCPVCDISKNGVVKSE
jgi:transposase-like protein